MGSSHSDENSYKRDVHPSSSKSRFKLFGKKAVAAMVKDLKQLEDGSMPGKKVIKAICPDTLTLEGKRQALNPVNLIKKERD